MKALYNDQADDVTKQLYSLAMGPDKRVNIYSGCIVNGVKFLTVDRDSARTTQNSGVCVEGYHNNESISYYGILLQIIELRYLFDSRVYLFKCQWYDLQRNKPIEWDTDFTSVNISKTWYDGDPYALANQAMQVFYTRDTKLKGDWRVVQRVQHRHMFDPALFENEDEASNDIEGSLDALQQDKCKVHGYSLVDEVEVGPLHRIDVEDIVIDNVSLPQRHDDFIVEDEDEDNAPSDEGEELNFQSDSADEDEYDDDIQDD